MGCFPVRTAADGSGSVMLIRFLVLELCTSRIDQNQALQYIQLHCLTAIKSAWSVRERTNVAFSDSLYCACAVMDNLKYAPSHEWVSVDGDVATVGISDFAQVRCPLHCRRELCWHTSMFLHS